MNNQEVRAVDVTSSSIGNAPVLPALLAQIPPGQEVGCGIADGAYYTCKMAHRDRRLEQGPFTY